MNKSIVNVDYDFEEDYVDNQGRNLTAKVRLSIDVKSKTFNVAPSSIKKDFVFMNTSQSNWQMWIAIAKAIQNAVEFAADYLKQLEEPATDGAVQ